MNNGMNGLGKQTFTKSNLFISGSFFAMGFLWFWLTRGDESGVWALGLLQMLAAVLISVLGFVVQNQRKQLMMAQLESFAFCSEAACRAAVLNFPSPMVVTDVNGVIQWYNRQFQKMADKGELYGEYLQVVFPALQFERFVQSGNPAPEEYTYRRRSYRVSGRMIDTGRVIQDGETETIRMVSIYFTDLTGLNRLRQQMADKKIVVCSAVVDNYDEVFKSTPNRSHGTLLGQIEHCISTWVEKGEGLSVRYERDRFLILFEEAKFTPLLQEKFTILDQVKQINQGNRVQVTLSIGVGQAKETLMENEKQAETALNMALGRGGDQVVVRTTMGFQFFGARSPEIEKSTRVKARVVAHRLRDLADHASRVMIMGHANADADSFGAAVGLLRMLRNWDVEAYILMDRIHNSVKNILDGILKHNGYNEWIIPEARALDLMDERTLVIVVDTHRPSIVQYPNVLHNARRVALIDHHRRAEDFIENAILTYHEPYVSSTSEMVTELLQYIESEKPLKPYEAEALYSGIYLDTKGFTFKTGVRTFEAASYLRRCGADPIDVRRLFRNDMDTYIQRSRIISGAKRYRGNVAIALCHEKSANIQVMVAQAADELLNIRGIEAAFVLATDGNRIVISGRSLGAVNVQLILEKLGGGGHITIAGAQLQNQNLEYAEAELCSAIDQVAEENEK